MKLVKNKIFIIIILSALLLCIFTSCSKEQEIEFTNNIETRYADGFSITDSIAAPQTAVEYVDEPRVVKQIYLDNRISGLHMTGLYIPKGESLNLMIDSSATQLKYKIRITSNENIREVEITTTQTAITVENGGIVELDLTQSQRTNLNIIKVSIAGCVESSYYRLGLEDETSLKDFGNYSIIDTTNFRLYFPSYLVGKIDDVEKLANFYRTTCMYFDDIFDLSFYDNDYSCLRVFVTDSVANCLYDASSNTIFVSTDFADTILSYEKMKNGEGSDLFDALGKMKAEISTNYKTGYLSSYMANIISSIAQMYMVDNNINKENYLFNSYNALNSVLDNSLNDLDNTTAFFINLYNSFGNDNIVNYLKSLKEKTFNDVSEFILDFSNYLNVDLTDYAGLFDIEIKDTTKQELSDKNMFVPVSTKYTLGEYVNSNKTGVVVNMGETTVFDFNNNLVSNLDNWTITKLEGSSCFSKDEDGTYLYNPSSELLQDSFKLYLSNGEFEKVLYGKITVNIAVGNYQLYENIKYKTIQDAIAKYKKELYPDEVKAVSSATVLSQEAQDDGYNTFAVTTGSFEVFEDCEYTFYLKSKGLCSVSFGVDKYMYEIFNISLTVTEFTDELKYTINLQKGVLYYYSIYVLSSEGTGRATLGIKKQDGVIDSLDSKYLVYEGLSKESTIVYSSPVKQVEKYYVQDATMFETTSIPESTIVPNTSLNILYVGDWKSTTKYVAVNGSVSETYGNNAYLTFSFYGDAISVYATKDAQYGLGKLEIDGKYYTDISLNSNVVKCGDLVAAVKLSEGEHTIKISPSTKEDIINIDYFSVSYIEQEDKAPNYAKIWYVAIIPILAIIGMIGAIIADIMTKKKAKNNRLGITKDSKN